MRKKKLVVRGRRRWAFVFVLLFFVSGLFGCTEAQPQSVSETRVLLDTFCSLTVYGARDQGLLNEVFDLCAGYEALLSVTVEGSDVWRINHSGGEPVAVAPETVELIWAGLGFGELSGGFFDVTVGGLTSLWDFSGGGGAVVPAEDEISAALLSVDYRQVAVDGGTVRLVDPGARLDLGAIAKGYIADMLADFLRSRGVTGAVIDLGGDVAVVGRKPDGEPWFLGVRRPFGGGDLLGVIETGEASVVTSGVYERMFEKDGVVYHHILDPFTGLPARSDVVGATIVARSAAIGDALSTIALLVGSGRAADLLMQADGFIGALLVLEGGEVLHVGDISFQEFG